MAFYDYDLSNIPSDRLPIVKILLENEDSLSDSYADYCRFYIANSDDWPPEKYVPAVLSEIAGDILAALWQPPKRVGQSYSGKGEPGGKQNKVDK